MKDQKGFTLIEMIVVMAILTILASAVYPRISGYAAANRERLRASQEYVVNKALVQYYALTGSYYAQTFTCNVGDIISDADVTVMINELSKRTGSMISNNSGNFSYIKDEGSDSAGAADIRRVKVVAP